MKTGLPGRSPGRHRPATLAVALAITGLTLAASGCGSGSGHAATAGAAGSSASRGSASRGSAPGAVAKPAVPETGIQLERLLPTRAELPPGWVYNASEGTGQAADSGAGVSVPPYIQALPRVSCQSMQDVGAEYLLDDDQAAAAQIEMLVGHGETTSIGSVTVASFYPGYAVKQFASVASFAFQRCRSYTKRDEMTNALVKMKGTAALVPGVGDQALLLKTIQVNGPLPDGDYYPGAYLLVFRVGNYMADIDAPGLPGHPEAKAVDSLASLLVRRLRQLG